MIPLFDKNIKCKHGRTFFEQLKLAARYAMQLYSVSMDVECGEEIILKQTFNIVTQPANVNKVLSLSHGRFNEYRWLQKYIYPGPLHCNFGSTAMSFHRATKQKLDKTFLLHTMSSTKVPRKVMSAKMWSIPASYYDS